MILFYFSAVLRFIDQLFILITQLSKNIDIYLHVTLFDRTVANLRSVNTAQRLDAVTPLSRNLYSVNTAKRLDAAAPLPRNLVPLTLQNGWTLSLRFHVTFVSLRYTTVGTAATLHFAFMQKTK
ncbi:hypothetical protein ABNX05_16190 [Lysinibacillus sp. M3]|uniref:Uncharacterized protein n=1 Tax=Lysinibacillus zambalensis TaxID=3160866 RepID=A0ABV1MUI1_9BACI